MRPYWTPFPFRLEHTTRSLLSSGAASPIQLQRHRHIGGGKFHLQQLYRRNPFHPIVNRKSHLSTSPPCRQKLQSHAQIGILMGDSQKTPPGGNIDSEFFLQFALQTPSDAFSPVDRAPGKLPVSRPALTPRPTSHKYSVLPAHNTGGDTKGSLCFLHSMRSRPDLHLRDTCARMAMACALL